MDRRPGTQKLRWARFGWGAGLLLFARPAAAAAGYDLDERAVWFARALGIRHVLQAFVLGGHPSGTRIRVGAAVDAAHGVSAVALGLADRKRPLLFVNAGTAFTWAALGYWQGRSI